MRLEQAFEYEKELPPGSTLSSSAGGDKADGAGAGALQEFFDSTAGRFRSDCVKSWLAELQRQRADFVADAGGDKTSGESQRKN